jgi:hypothetical protein
MMITHNETEKEEKTESVVEPNPDCQGDGYDGLFIIWQWF